MFLIVRQRRLLWLGHVLMIGGRIPKSLLWKELVVVKRNRSRPRLRLKYVRKRDLKSLNIGTNEWELLVNDCVRWRSAVHKGQVERNNNIFRNRSWRRNDKPNEFNLIVMLHIQLLIYRLFFIFIATLCL